MAAPPSLLDVRGLRKVFASKALFAPTRRVVASEDVSFRIERGEAVALVGESGSGKSTVARILLRLEKPDSGEIRLDGEDVLAREPKRASLRYRSRIQMVFQDPFGSLNSVHRVSYHLARPLLRHGQAKPGDVRARSLELLETVGLQPAEEYLDRYPYELSGGQRQRVAIARALAVDPDVLVADEPTSMLDVSIRMSILNLLVELKRERGLAILLITHDLASARFLADRVLVLFRGRVVEDGPADSVVQSPVHPYTRALLGSIADAADDAAPIRDREPDAPPAAQRSVAADPDAEEGCPFASRCAEIMDICLREDPEPRTTLDRQVRCHLFPTAGSPTKDLR